jgi:hypothetical protein
VLDSERVQISAKYDPSSNREELHEEVERGVKPLFNLPLQQQPSTSRNLLWWLSERSQGRRDGVRHTTTQKATKTGILLPLQT